ncbi:MAG: helix-turn-helix transcriptional regulator [Vicinamibacterales bacterium]
MANRILQARLDYQARTGKPLSIEALAERFNVSGVTVGRWERGERMPGLEQIERLAAELGTGVELAPGGVGRHAPR